MGTIIARILSVACTVGGMIFATAFDNIAVFVICVVLLFAQFCYWAVAE